jgi:polyvinyl alcohol dehydrogenase (cytochrome)
MHRAIQRAILYFAAALAASAGLAASVAFAAPAALADPAAAPPSADGRAGDVSGLREKMDASKAPADRESLPGAAIYHGRCQFCHEGQASKAPSRTFLEMMAPESIYRAVSVGIMQRQAAGLTDADKRHVAEYLAGKPFGAAESAAAPHCSGAAARFVDKNPDIVGWGFNAGNDHFVPAAAARLAAADIPRLRVKWTFAYPATVRARSQPTFAYGALYVGSQNGVVYALDAKLGCIRWSFETTAEVRTAIVVPAVRGAEKRAYFGDIIGRVYALDAATGKELWRARVDAHPSATVTGSPAYHDGVLYVPVSSLEEATVGPSYPCCTFRGSVAAFDAATGRRLWQRYTIEEAPREVAATKTGTKVYAPSGAAVWNAPTVDARRGVLYIGTGNNYTGPPNGRSNSILALDLATGVVRWSWQAASGDAWNVGCMIGLDSCPPNSGPDFDIGSGVMLGRLGDGKELLFAGSKSGTAIALDPERHDRASWSDRPGRGSIQGGIQFGMAFDGTRLYVPIADMANSNDQSEKAHTSGPAKPGLYALDGRSGQLVWQAPADNVCHERPSCDPGILAAISAIRGAVFAGHMDGRVRAYDSESGKVIWEFDTARDLPALGGVTAHGGSIGGGGPVVHDGMLYVNSGYGMYFHMPGNALIAFSVDGR